MIGDSELKAIEEGLAEHLGDDVQEPLRTIATWGARLAEDARWARRIVAAISTIRRNEHLGQVASKHLFALYKVVDDWVKT